jgi:murein tripeptide amidase MpaA
MAAWSMEGLIARLLDAQDPIGDALQDGAVLYLVPGMNPDGAVLGNHRTNAAGRDLNREWLSPSEERSPEVFHVRRAILDGGVDLFLDVHGEESLPYVFAAACEGIPDYTERLKGLEDLFASHLAGVDPDFQREHGYELDAPGQADLRIASNYIAQRCDCLSLTLEMPFKDNVNRPDEEAGWSPERSGGFGRSTLESVLACLGALR